MSETRNNNESLSNNEPIFIARKPQDDITTTNVKRSNEVNSRKELYNALQIGYDQIQNGEFITHEEMMEHLKKYIRK